jgi:gas vesicle protein
VIAWLLLGGLVVAAIAAVVLALLLRHARARTRRTDEIVADARRAVRAAAEEETAQQIAQIRIAITRAQADSVSAYVSEERRLSDQHRGEFAVRERDLSDRMAEMVAAVERRVEERLRAWEADLERAQRALEGEVTTLEQRQRQRIEEVEARIEAEAYELGTTADQQRAAAIRLREELESSARDALTQALDELQVQTDDRRRAIEDVMERLRQHEHTIGEQVDRAEAEARGRIESAFDEIERRQVAELERETGRQVERLSEAGALEFENRMKAIREEAATRLRDELDHTTETFLRRADGLIAQQLQQAADAATARLEDRIIEAARRYEASRSSAGV